MHGSANGVLRRFGADRTSALALAMVALALLFAVYKGVSGEARHIDARYFYAAADCLHQGKSPYNVASFGTCWTVTTGTPFRSSFVFPPTVFVYAYPMAWMSWKTAQIYLDGLTIVAMLLLARVLWSIAGIGERRDGTALLAAAWVALGIANTGVSSSLFVGQPTVFVALGVGLLIRGMIVPAQRRYIVSGTLLASIKPHLSLFSVLTVWLAKPTEHLREKIVAVVLFVGLVLIVFAISDNPVANYFAALDVHESSKYTRLSEPESLYGLRSLISLVAHSPSAIAALAVLAAIAAAAVFAVREPCRWGIAFCALASVGGPFLFPHKGYDFAIYAVAFALAARFSLKLQAVMLLPFLLIFRPTFASAAVHRPQFEILAVDMSLLFLVCVFAAVLARGLLGRARQPRTG